MWPISLVEIATNFSLESHMTDLKKLTHWLI